MYKVIIKSYSFINLALAISTLGRVLRNGTKASRAFKLQYFYKINNSTMYVCKVCESYNRTGNWRTIKLISELLHNILFAQ